MSKRKRFINTLRKCINFIFGTHDNILSKMSFSLFITGFLFLVFAYSAKENNNLQSSNIFTYISSLLIGVWMASIQENKSVKSILNEAIRLIWFFYILALSLDFCLNTSLSLQGSALTIHAILSCIGLLSCSFYFVSKFVDIFHFVKNIFLQIKCKLFNSTEINETERKTTRLTAFIENITAFFVSIAGLGVAIKTIVEPIINLIK